MAANSAQALHTTYDYSQRPPNRDQQRTQSLPSQCHRNHGHQEYQLCLPRRRDHNRSHRHSRRNYHCCYRPKRPTSSNRAQSSSEPVPPSTPRNSNRPESSSKPIHPIPTNRSELGSHADKCIAGSNCAFISGDGRTANVSPAVTNFSCDNVPIGTVATYWESPDGTPYILIIHEALYFGDRVDTTLLTPNQMRHNGLVVEDVPRQFDLNSTHSIYDPVSRVRIPLSLNGVFSGFTSYKPSEEE
jgi:hypothetical protein